VPFGSFADIVCLHLQVLNFTPNKIVDACHPTPTTYEGCLRFIAIHEFGHALGFAHEHNRYDTPRDICTEDDSEKDAPVGLVLTPYDELSIVRKATFQNRSCCS
jgi:hypothetical protein